MPVLWQSILHQARALALVLNLPMTELELDNCVLDPSVQLLADDILSERCVSEGGKLGEAMCLQAKSMPPAVIPKQEFATRALTNTSGRRGVIIAAAHFGHWEMIVPVLTHRLHQALAGRPVYIAYKPLHYFLTDRCLLEIRTAAARSH